MSSAIEVEPSHTLATLPRPVDSTHGRVCAAGVYSISGCRKRKRTEIAVGIDGEGVNIYNVKSPRLVSSYALPPQTYFTTPPSSIYCRKEKSRPAKRLTYASVVNSGASKRFQIVRFAEEVQSDAPGAGPVTSKVDVPGSKSKVFSVEPIASYGTSSSLTDNHVDVVVLHGNGDVVCLSEDLQTARWKCRLHELVRTGLPERKDDVAIVYSCYTSVNAARKGLLKNRPDVEVILDPANEGATNTFDSVQILCALCESPDDTSKTELKLHLFSLRPRTNELRSNLSPLQHLVSWTLPSIHARREKKSQSSFSIHPQSGVLVQLSGGSLTTYDLSEAVPRLVSELGHSEPFESFARISSSLLVATSSNSCGVYDVHFNTEQAMIPLAPGQNTDRQRKKRKHMDTHGSSARLALLSYFPDASLLVGLSDSELVGFHMSLGPSTTQQGKAQAGRMIDAIGRGIQSHLSSKRLHGSQPIHEKYGGYIQSVSTGRDKKWAKRQNELSGLAEQGDVRRFDEMFGKALHVTFLQSTCRSNDQQSDAQKETESLPNGNASAGNSDEVNGTGEEHDTSRPDMDDEPLEWDFSRGALRPDREKALFALGYIFHLAPPVNGTSISDQSNPVSSVAIQFLPPNVFRWLLHTGQLREDLIALALQRQNSATDSVTITDSDIVSAIFAFDPDMHLLHDVLCEPAHLPISVVVHAIKHLIRSLDNRTVDPSHPPLLLTAGDSADIIEASLEDAEAAAATDLTHALTTLESGLTLRSRSLRAALTRLHAFPAPSIAPALRAALARHELVFLIHLLRVELADGGWTSRYVDVGLSGVDPSTEDEDNDTVERPSDRGIVIIAALLGHILDALGMAGWLAGHGGGGSDADEVLRALRAEVSAALEGIHEATFLAGLLGEFALSTARRLGVEKKGDRRERGVLTTRDKKPPTVMADVEEDDMEGSMLPIGMRDRDKPVERTRLEVSGVQRAKSSREKGMEMSRRVEKYRLERIRF